MKSNSLGFKTCKKWLTSTVIATSILGNVLNAQTITGSIETIASAKNTILDSKLSLDLSKEINLFARNRTTFDYQSGQKKPFTLTDLSYNWKNGLGIVAETQFSGEGNPDPRLGVQYFKKIGSVSIYTMGTVGDTQGVNGEILARLRYSQPFTSNLEGIMQLETITDFNRRITFATQRCRLGMGIGKKIEFGFAAEMVEIPLKKKINTNYQLGGYLSYKF